MRHHLVEMGVHRLGGGRDVSGVRIKNSRIHRVGQLDERAVRTKQHALRQGDFIAGHFFRIEKVIHERGFSEVEDELEVFGAASAAMGACLDHDGGSRYGEWGFSSWRISSTGSR